MPRSLCHCKAYRAVAVHHFLPARSALPLVGLLRERARSRF